MLDTQTERIANHFPGNYSGNNNWLGNLFAARNIVIQFSGDRPQSHLFIPLLSSMTTAGIDVLTSLYLKDADGNDLVGNVQEAFINAANHLRQLSDPETLLD